MPLIKKQNTNWRRPISPTERLAVTLRFLATGMSFRAIAFSYRMGKSTVANIVNETCNAIWLSLQNTHMPFPTTKHLESVAEGFYTKWNFSNCFGAIDGKHIRCICSNNSGSMFLCYKNFFSIVLQAVVASYKYASYKFIRTEVGSYGKQSDGGIFQASLLHQLLEADQFNVPKAIELPNSQVKLPFVLVGDEAYPLLPYLLKPYSKRNLTRDQCVFNYRLSRARQTVECAFGIIAKKWRILLKAIETQPCKAETIVKTICLLHNISSDKEGLDETAMNDSTLPKLPDNLPSHINRIANTVRTNRDHFKDYFTSPEGAIPEQFYNV